MVVDQNQLVGLVTVRDMLRFIDRQIPLDTPHWPGHDPGSNRAAGL